MDGRFLPYAEFCEERAKGWRLGYYSLRIPAIILAAVVPALVAANLGSTGRWVATALSVTVATLSAVEHFLDAGGRWRHYRGLVKRFKSEAWAYVALATPYSGYRDHDSALGRFVDHVERVIRSDVGEYVALVDTEIQHSHVGPQASATTTGAPPASVE